MITNATFSTSYANNGTFSFSTVNVNSNLTNNGTLSASALTGSGNFIQGTTGAFNFSGSTISITGFNPSATGNIVIYNGSAQTVKAASYNNLTLSGSGSKTTTGATVNGILSMEGTATTTGTTPTYGANATLQYKGSAAQTTGSEFPAIWTGAGGVIIDNTSGITLNGSKAVNKITLTNGILTIPALTKLTVSTPAAIGGLSFGDSKHIATGVNTSNGSKGVFQVNGITSAGYTFPVGNGTYYLPATISPSVISNFSVTAFQGITQNGQPNGTALASKQTVVDAVWDVTNVSNNSAVTSLKTGWPAVLEGTGFADLLDAEQGITHNDGTAWDIPSGSTDGDLQTATRTGITSFSPFSVGQKGQNIILPVHFSSIKAVQKPGGIQISWSNSTEENIQVYEVERSGDGHSFSTIVHVLPVKNNYGNADYQLLDAAPLSGNNYYRIRAVERDGRAIYSAVVRIGAMGSGTALVVFPNPAKGRQISFTASNLPAGRYSLKVYSAAGQLVSAQSLEHNGGTISQIILLSGAGAGRYLLEVNGAVHLVQPLLIQ
jgi:hypothetical protein